MHPQDGRRPGPQRILVQYVPQAFGLRGANLPFCVWLRSRRRGSIWVMFHEVMFLAEGDRRLSHRALAAVNRWMATLAAGSAERTFVSIPGWRALLEARLPQGARVAWLPVPSVVPVLDDPRATARLDRTLVSPERNLPAILENLRQTTENLRDVTETLRRSPSAVLFSEPPAPLPRPGTTRR